MSNNADVSSQVNTDNVSLSISDNVVVNQLDNETTNNSKNIELTKLKSTIFNHDKKIENMKKQIQLLNDEYQDRVDNENPFQLGSIVDVLQLETNKYISGKILEIGDNGLFKLDYGGGQSETLVNVSRMKKPERSNNGWTKEKDSSLRTMLAKLKFNREVTRFYFYRVRKEEGYWSWLLIILATFTSTITLGNNVTNEPFMYYFTIIKILLTLLAACTTLVAAWIKKQGYIERINNCDRYLQKAAQLIEAFDLILINAPSSRMSYREYDDKLLPIYRNLSTIPPMSPNEQKYCEYLITVNHPEIISTDDSSEMRLWPWFEIDDEQYYENDDNNSPVNFEKKFITDFNLNITSFGESVIRSYLAKKKKQESCNIFKCFGCFNSNPDKLVSNYYKYFGLEYDKIRKKPIDIQKTEILTSSNAWENMVNEVSKKPLITYSQGDVLCLSKKFEEYLNYSIVNYKLPSCVDDNLVGIVMNNRICNNELVYLCRITSLVDTVRDSLEKTNIVKSRVVSLKYIDIDKTKKLTEEQKTELKKLIQINDV